MSELIDINAIASIIPISTIAIVLLIVLILGLLFWVKSKDIQIQTLKGQVNFLMKLTNENFIEILMERERNKTDISVTFSFWSNLYNQY